MSETAAAVNDGTMIEKFDPSKLMDGVKDRIKSTFVSLIPDDAWEKMVEKEIYVFTTGRIEYEQKCNYNKKTKTVTMCMRLSKSAYLIHAEKSKTIGGEKSMMIFLLCRK